MRYRWITSIPKSVISHSLAIWGAAIASRGGKLVTHLQDHVRRELEAHVCDVEGRGQPGVLLAHEASILFFVLRR